MLNVEEALRSPRQVSSPLPSSPATVDPCRLTASPRARSASGASRSASPLLAARGEHWTDQLSPDQLKRLPVEQKQKQEAMQEIVLAERAYVRDLRLITRVFMDEMRERGLATKEEMASIFSNIPTLLNVHTELLEELEQLKKEHGMIVDDGIGKIFQYKANLFKHYANYCVNYIGMSHKLATLREHPKFVEFLEECKKNPECRNSSLESFLITPLQRMAKYPLLLASLLKYTDKTHAEYAPLAKAYEEIKNVVDQVNNRAQQEENVRKVMDLQAAVEQVHGDVYKFCEWGRHIIKEGPVRVLQGKKKPRSEEFHLVIFNDKMALFRVKGKGKKTGYKVISIWNFNQIYCSPLESPLAPAPPSSSPTATRLRSFSRGNTDNSSIATTPGRHSIMLTSPIHSSPRARPVSMRNLKEIDSSEAQLLEEAEKDKDKDGPDHRLLFGSPAERDDWIAKLKEQKVDYVPKYEAQQVEEAETTRAKLPPSLSFPDSPSWEKKYHLEVEIRSELKRVLDQTMQQLNVLHLEIETLKKEKETLREENARFKEENEHFKEENGKREQREKEKEERKSLRAKERKEKKHSNDQHRSGSGERREEQRKEKHGSKFDRDWVKPKKDKKDKKIRESRSRSLTSSQHSGEIALLRLPASLHLPRPTPPDHGSPKTASPKLVSPKTASPRMVSPKLVSPKDRNTGTSGAAVHVAPSGSPQRKEAELAARRQREREMEMAKKTKTVGRKAITGGCRPTVSDRMLSLDLPFDSASIGRARGGEDEVRPLSAREPRRREDDTRIPLNIDGRLWMEGPRLPREGRDDRRKRMHIDPTNVASAILAARAGAASESDAVSSVQAQSLTRQDTVDYFLTGGTKARLLD